MRIRRMYVNGFGVHRDRTFNIDEDAQATVLFGRNEAGKSTLMGFVRSMLFGFPKRNHRLERYEPLSGGMHGGVITIVDQLGQEIRIERYEKNGSLKLIYPDGAQSGEAALQALLGGINAELYRNLFAFSLSELQRMDTLHAEEISGFLLSAGMGIDGSVMVQAERKLAQEMDALYKRQGMKQAINEQLQIIEHSEQELRKSKEKSGKYREWQVELASLDISIEADGAELSLRKAELDWLNKCQQSRDSWIQLLEVEHELSSLPVFADFPEHTLGRYEKLQEELDRANKELQDIQQERINKTQQMHSITVNERLITHRAELEQLLEAAVLSADSRLRIADSTAELVGYRAQLHRYLRQISSDWTEAELQQFPISIYQREQVNGFAERFVSLNHRAQSRNNDRLRIEEQAEQAKFHQRELQHKRNEISQLMASEFHNLLVLGLEKLHSYELEVRKLWELTRKLASDLTHMKERLADAKYNEQILQPKRVIERQRMSRPKSTITIVRAIAIAINLMIPMWIILSSDNVTIGVAVFIALGVLNLILWLQKPTESFAHPLVDESLQREAISHRERMEKEVEKTRIQWVDRCEQLLYKLDIHPIGNRGSSEAAAGSDRAIAKELSDEQETLQLLEPWVEALLQHLTEYRQSASEQRDIDDQLKLVTRDLDEITKRLDITMDLERKQQEEEALLRLEWVKWLDQYQLPIDLTVESMTAMFQYAESGLQVMDQIRRINNKLTTYEESLHAFEIRAVDFLREQDIDIPNNLANISYELKKLKELLDRQASAQEQVRHLEEQLQDLNHREFHCAATISNNTDKLSELLLVAKAADEDELRRSVRFNDRRVELEMSKRHLQVVIFTWVKDEHQHQLFKTLEQSDAAQLEHQLLSVNGYIQQLELTLNESKDRRGGLRKEMDNLQSGGQHAELLQRHQEHIDELQLLASKWAELALSAELMRRAKDIYERERQPGVLLRASQYMRTITAGQFIRVISRMGEKSIFVERESGEQLDSTLLSRGTAEQLYLAMRFALADEYSKTAALPLIMDDIFVNFDADRLTRTLSVLSDVAKRHQIILFTCHEHVVHALQAALPRLQLIDLDEPRS